MRRRECLSLGAGALWANASLRAWEVASRSSVVTLSHGAELHSFSVLAEDNVDLQVVTFTSQRCSLKIVDNADRVSLSVAMQKTGAVAGTNGGYFSPDFTALGLTQVDGKRMGTWVRSSLLGGVIQVRQGRLSLVWRDEYREAPGSSQLLQTGPRLVNAGQVIPGLDTKASRPRTFILTDGATRWALGVARYCSLAQLAQILISPELLPGMKVHRALNLDGGRSTGLWAGPDHYDSPMVSVRNYVAVVPVN